MTSPLKLVSEPFKSHQHCFNLAIADQWSLGVLCYILLSGYSPFLEDGDDQATMANVTRSDFRFEFSPGLVEYSRSKYDFDYEEFDEVTAVGKDFITRLLRKEPARRMTAAACLQHEWLRETFMRKKTTRINVKNLRKFLARRKVQNVGRALKAISILKGAGKLYRYNIKTKFTKMLTLSPFTILRTFPNFALPCQPISDPLLQIPGLPGGGGEQRDREKRCRQRPRPGGGGTHGVG